MTEAGDGVDPVGRGARSIDLSDGALVVAMLAPRSRIPVASTGGSVPTSSSLRETGDAFSSLGEPEAEETGCTAAMPRSMRSHRAPTFVPRAAETASAGIFVPLMAFISGNGHGAMSVMLHTISIGTALPPVEVAVPRQRDAYARIVSARLAVHTITACRRTLSLRDLAEPLAAQGRSSQLERLLLLLPSAVISLRVGGT